MDEVTKLKVTGVLLLVVVPLVTLLATALLGLRFLRKASGEVVLTLAISVAMTCTHIGLVGLPTLPITDVTRYAPFFFIGVPAIFVFIERSSRLGLVAPLAAVSLIVANGLMLGPVYGGEFAPPDRVATGAAIGLAVWLVVDRLARVLPTPALFASLSLAALVAGASSLVSGTMLLAQALGGVAAVNGFTALLTWRQPRLVAGRAAVAAALFPLLVGVGISTYYGELPPLSAALLVLSPTGAAAGLLSQSLIGAALIALLATAVTLGLGLWSALAANAERHPPPVEGSSDSSAPSPQDYR
ncbi:MAG: hypothetical protein EXR76_14110 [Myxococcales bacterium]|nr:hypothetical protein [Myxococcales bacterium]